uniref:F-box domain-containing protein n=1 Tax=Hordeum vulgare subsp. vulgare TaxID=112509 RepID=A0A8I6X7B1_HORVV
MIGDDRLSDLPDDLLRRIFHFAPAKEAASTTALSRRWRTPLWRSTGAVNLETRIHNYDRHHSCRNIDRKDDEAGFFSRREAFVSAAMAVLDAAADDDLVTRLTLCLNSDNNYAVAEFLDGSSYEYAEPHQKNLVDVVLAHPAARRVEELCLVAKECTSDPYDDGEISCNWIGAFVLTLDSLPSETLRVLDLTNCEGLYQPNTAVVVLPRLSSLRLRHCAQHLGSLQSIIDAAPVLAAVRLESVLIDCWGYGNYIDRSDEDDPPSPPKEVATCRLRCPAATLLVLERCKWEEKDHGQHGSWPTYGGGHYDDELVSLITAEIEAPRLRRFTYKGFLRPFSFSSQPPELEQADLEFFPYQGNENYKNREPNRVLATIWRLVRSFTSTRGMKLRLNHLEDMAVLSEARRVQLQPVFRRLERLELQGVHRPKGKTAAVTIANLLHCCPVLRDLFINLTSEHQDGNQDYGDAHEFLERKFRYDRDKSMDRFDHCGDSEPDMVLPEVDGDGVNYDEVSEIPALNRHSSFECLQSSLRRVCLQFQLEKSNCLGLQLIKFFAENAMVLEEMHIDGGNAKLWEHMNSKIQTWIDNSCKRNKPGAPSFVVLPTLEGVLFCSGGSHFQ